MGVKLKKPPQIYICWLEWLRVVIPDFQNVWCLNITINFLIAMIPIFLQLSANRASYTGIETLTSCWLLNNIWVEEELNLNSNLLQRKFRRKQGKILNRKIYSQEVSILDFKGTFLGFSMSIPWNELRSFRLRVVSPTVCSPTVRVDSPTSHMSVRLRIKLLTLLLKISKFSISVLLATSRSIQVGTAAE